MNSILKMTKSSSSVANLKDKDKRQFKSKNSKDKQTERKNTQKSYDKASENEVNTQTEQFHFDISNLVATNQQEIDSGSFPSYEPPPGWKKIESNDFSTFDFKNVHEEENELWLFKIPPTVSKSDLQGLTLKLPIGVSRVPTKVATIQKALQDKKTKTELTEYHVYEMPNDDNISQEDETAKEFIRELRAPHETIFRRMKELEIFLPCQEAQGLLLSHKRPTRYFNICRPVNPPDPSLDIDSILAKKPEPIPHPSETFIPRYTVSFPDYSKKHMIEARAVKKKFRNRMMNEWKFPRWQQQMKEHEEMAERAYKEYQRKCKMIVNKSKKKFAKKVEKKKGRAAEEEKPKNRKRKSSNVSMEDDYNIPTSGSESEKPLKKKILTNLKRQRKFKRNKIEESDTDPEILEEVAEEEIAFIKLVKDQINQRKQEAKETCEAEKRAADTWTPALVSYPVYKPPETWWSKTYDKILNETEQTKLRPKLAKRRYTLEERLEYYKKHGCEPPLYAVPRSRGKKIEINYAGIEENLEIPKPRRKAILPPPPPGTTGHLQPCIELID